jgi:cell division protease FtsH
VARAMVTEYGMTERLGAIKLGDNNSEPFLGRDLGHQRNYSEDVAAVVDAETKQLLANAHQEAFDILAENRDVLDDLVTALLEKETLDKAEIAEVFRPLRRRPGRPAWTGSPTREPSSIPPVHVPKAASNGHGPDQSEGAVILTPPGSGGDVHGDPNIRSSEN